jgi:hypothetical protein
MLLQRLLRELRLRLTVRMVGRAGLEPDAPF